MLQVTGGEEAGARIARAPAESLYSRGMADKGAGGWLFPAVGIAVLTLRAVGFSGRMSSVNQIECGVLTAGLVFGYLAYRRVVENRNWAEFGFVRPSLGDGGVGLAVCALDLAIGAACFRLGLVPSAASSNAATAAVTGTLAVWALCAQIALDAFAEECIFRAYMIPFLEERRGTAAAVVLSSLVFGAIHYTGIIPATLTGALLCAAFLRRRSIWAPLFAHAASNMIVLLAARFTAL